VGGREVNTSQAGGEVGVGGGGGAEVSTSEGGRVVRIGTTGGALVARGRSRLVGEGGNGADGAGCRERHHTQAAEASTSAISSQRNPAARVCSEKK
jgi:hypothetical protein